MNLFETIKAAVSIPEAAKYYGLSPDCGSKICCIFHDDQTPSLQLNEDYFYCYGCQASGDVVDFVARLFGLTCLQAAQKLAHDFGIDPNTPARSALPVFGRDAELEEAIRKLQELVKTLRTWQREYAPKVPGEKYDKRFARACLELPTMEYYLEALRFGDSKERQKILHFMRERDAA